MAAIVQGGGCVVDLRNFALAGKLRIWQNQNNMSELGKSKVVYEVHTHPVLRTYEREYRVTHGFRKAFVDINLGSSTYQ